MVDISALKAPEASNEAGQWVMIEDGPLKGVELCVRGMQSRPARRFIARQGLRTTIRRGKVDLSDDAVVDSLIDGQGALLAEVILLDWRGLTSGGEPFPFDRDFVRAALAEDDMSPLAEAIAWAAAQVDRGFEEAAAELEKNSPARSDGKSTAAKPSHARK